MHKTTALLAAFFFLVSVPVFAKYSYDLQPTTCSRLVETALAEYSVSDRGEWPKSWPKQLDPLRNQSRTLVGPMVEYRWFAIRFTKREEFEAAWPHILKVKTKRAPIYLVRAPNFFLGEQCKAGVVIHCPPLPPPSSRPTPEAPIAGVTNPAEGSMNATYIQLLVDDDIVNLKRIAMPKGVTVIDERTPAVEKGS